MCAVFCSSCSEGYDDSALRNDLNSLEARVAKLEEMCKQMNTNISSLQTIVNALKLNDYITNVSPVRKEGKIIGYTISFAHSDTITIYNGEDGANGIDGVNGKDGYVPQIGVMKDTDGVYYWTIDGEWLLDANGNKIKAVGEDGKNGADGKDGVNGEPGSDGENGKNGADGEDGKDGKDGITPQLKIEDDYWYVSYDNGSSWTKLGKATGADGADGSDGADGTDGEDGDNIFSSVTQDEEYVYFNLADGTIIILPKQDKENIQFEDLRVKMLCCTRGVDKNNDGEISYSEAAAITGLSTVFKGNTDIVAFTELKYFTGLTKIDDNAFRGCTNLWKITFPDNIKEIGEFAFYECNDLQIIDIPNGVTTIGLRAFSGCSKAKYVSLPHSVITLGDDCFQNVTGELTINCNIPDAIYSSIYWNGPFINSKFSSLTIGDEVNVIGKRSFNEVTSLTSLIMGDNVKNIGEYAFSGCTNLKSEIKIPQSVISMGRCVFVYCDSVTKASIECENIGKEAFAGCDSLSSVVLSESVKIISENAFSGCPTITTITLPSSITNIEKYAFNCKNLKIVYCKPTTPPTIDSHIFGYDATINTIYVPTESVDLYKSAINWSNHFDIIQGKEF